MKPPTKPHQRALLLAKAYQMLDKCRDIFDVCDIDSHFNDDSFDKLLSNLDKEFIRTSEKRK